MNKRTQDSSCGRSKHVTISVFLTFRSWPQTILLPKKSRRAFHEVFKSLVENSWKVYIIRPFVYKATFFLRLPPRKWRIWLEAGYIQNNSMSNTSIPRHLIKRFSLAAADDQPLTGQFCTHRGINLRLRRTYFSEMPVTPSIVFMIQIRYTVRPRHVPSDEYDSAHRSVHVVLFG